MNRYADFIVVGGGVIGLAIADSLAATGAQVIVLDAGAAGSASTAAAGMLTPFGECHEPGPMLDICVESLRGYPSYVAGLHDVTGHAVELYGPGLLRIARGQLEEQILKEQFGWQSRLFPGMSWLNSAQMHSLEPGLSESVTGGILSPGEQCVDPRHLTPALQTSCLTRQVAINSATVVGFETVAGCVQEVVTQSDRYPCGAVILAGGAWSQSISQLLDGAYLPVKPIRGQLVSLGPYTRPPIRHTIFSRGEYLVSRPNGRIIAGTTIEPEAGFDARSTVEGIRSIMQNGSRLVPGLANAPFDRAWAGLRPVTPDGLPVLGRIPGSRNAYVATGHGRNGILLTPVTASVMVDHILNQSPIPEAFRPDRFQEAQCSLWS